MVAKRQNKTNTRSSKGFSVSEDGYSEDLQNGTARIVCSSERMLTIDDVIKVFKIDTDIWEIVSFKIKPHEGYRKDRKVRWVVQDGVVVEGDVTDTGKMLVVPLYGFEVSLAKKKDLINTKIVLSQLMEDAKKHAPKYPRFKRIKDTGLMLELVIADLHFGRLAWREESGGDYDIKIASADLLRVVDGLIQRSSSMAYDKIIIPVCGDFFNSDHKLNTTTNGTWQDEDTRWQKTFRFGRQLAVNVIDMCAALAPVEVIIIRGNHDNQRSFFLGDSLMCWYNNTTRVKIDNIARPRKYKQWGNVLLGFAHGHSEKKQSLPMLMANEARLEWSASTYREFHIGHWHHKTLDTFEDGGVTVKTFRSLASSDAWTMEMGLNMSLRSGEAMAWSKEKGLLATFNEHP